jgi:hypothetical protein
MRFNELRVISVANDSNLHAEASYTVFILLSLNLSVFVRVCFVILDNCRMLILLVLLRS